MAIKGAQIDGFGGGEGGYTVGGATGGTSTGTSTGTSAAKRAGAAGFGMNQIPVIVTDITKGAVRGPAIPVQPGTIVEVWPIPTNTQVCFSALGPDQAKNGPRAYHMPTGVQAQYSVSNLAEIWVAANVNNEGVLLVIRSK